MHAKSLLMAAIALLAAAQVRAADFMVSTPGFFYDINGNTNPELTLQRNTTYTFLVDAPGHPFWIKTAQSTGTGSAFSTGVTNNGLSSGTLTFTVPATAPNTLFYICQFHGSMTNVIHIVDRNIPVTPSSWSTVKQLYH